MRSEGLVPTVFDVWRAAELPNELLVGGGLSVVKLHGSAYGLRVGETLDDPLPDPEKRKLVGYLPPKPLLLVLGYGGQDRRIMELVAEVLERGGPEGGPHVVWVHFERTRPNSVNDLAARYNLTDTERRGGPPPLITARTFDAGAFLIGLHARLTSSQPMSAESYSAHSQRPLGLVASEIFVPDSADSAAADPWAEPERWPVHVFSGMPPVGTPSAGAAMPVDATSIAMSEFLSEHASTHIPIWLDAGMLQSIEELVSEVMYQCRKHDQSLPSVSLTLGGSLDSETRVEGLRRAAGRVHATLRRGSYILAIDEIGAFGRPPTTHHGLPYSCASHRREKVIELCRFLTLLVEKAHDCKASYICLAINEVVDRFSTRVRTMVAEQKRAFDDIAGQLRKFREQMQQMSGGGVVRFRSVSSQPLPENAQTGAARAAKAAQLKERLHQEYNLDDSQIEQRLSDLNALIATFRRPRSLVALRRIAIDYFPPNAPETSEVAATTRLYKDLDIWLDWLQERQDLFGLGGELYWMPTHNRDRVYESASSLATGKAFLDAVQAPKEAYLFLSHAYDPQPFTDPELLSRMVRELARLVLQHRAVARYYYSDLFLASKDMTAYSEYLYHRISAIRYVTALAALVLHQNKQLTAPGLEPSDPVGRFEYKWLSARGLRGAPKERLDDIRSLVRTLERDRDVLMSHLPSDTLLGWIEWIVPHDLPRFLLSHYGVKATPQTVEGQAEERIAREVRKMGRMLRDLHGKVLREKTDYEGCIQVRVAQVYDLLDVDDASTLGRSAPQEDVDLGPGLVEKRTAALLERTASLFLERKAPAQPGSASRRWPPCSTSVSAFGASAVWTRRPGSWPECVRRWHRCV